MARGDSLARQLSLIQLLEERREVVVGEAAKELGYTPRTIYRDLAVLERVGVPLYKERSGPRARWRIVEGYRWRLSLSLSFAEMLALSAGRELLAGFAGRVRVGSPSCGSRPIALIPSTMWPRAPTPSGTMPEATQPGRGVREVLGRVETRPATAGDGRGFSPGR